MNQSQLVVLVLYLFLCNVSGLSLSDSQSDTLDENHAHSPPRLRHDVPGFVKGNQKRSLRRTFAQSLFEDQFSRKVREAVLETLFFKKMINNTLSPEEYGGYMVQDAAYIFDAIKAFDIAAENMQGKSPPDFALFYRGRSASFKSYSTYFASKWKLQSTKSVIMGPAAATYVAYEMKLAQTKSKLLAIGILPCDMLWPWVAAQINSKVSKANVYRSWVDDKCPDLRQQIFRSNR